MQNFRSFLLLFAFLGGGALLHAQAPAIIPAPVSATWLDGKFIIDKNTVLIAGAADSSSAGFFNAYLRQIYGFTLPVRAAGAQPSTDYILLSGGEGPGSADDGMGAGGARVGSAGAGADAGTGGNGSAMEGRYTLKVRPGSVVIRGDTHSGVFYGMQTLLQLLPVSPYVVLATGPAVRPAAHGQGLSAPAVSIEDYPRFAYRGLHLDVCRHFFPVSFVKRYIDYIALHKMNYFHWHLTDDQGWRVEIKKYPRLTEVGSCRAGTIIGHFPGTGNDSTPHCGYYTQEEIREVVKYAADRFVTIIPEIELPGHSSAALTAYPWLGCTGGPYKVQGTWGVFKDVYCGGNDSVFNFLEDVLDEVMTLFPSRLIHIGGDECPKDSWKVCPKCQKRIKDLGLKDENGLQSYFVQRIEKYLNSKGRQIIGWDEILEGGLAPNATVMSWRGEQGGIDAAKQHHAVIMTPGDYCYFDHSQLQNDDSLTIGGYLPLEKVYAYEPVPQGLTEEEGKSIRGAQANLWTEYITNTRKVEYMLLPRLSALSEVLWSPKAARSWPDFVRRLQTQYIRYQLWKTNYYHAYLPATDTLVQQKLAQWQDSKFGLMMHWGTYSQWGIVESWSICPEDEGWTQRRGPYSADYNEYVKNYRNLQTTFNPTKFDAAKWAAAAKDAGMKYVVFTTKHHDGFCMFDTQQTDYKITSSKTPFSSNAHSNVAKEIFDAFRADDFMIGAYFSKPDWNSTHYWWPYFPPKDRNVNYDPAKYPERWQAFKDYTYNQIEELMTGYGKMDLLWLDGGWVRPLYSIDESVDWQKSITYDQDIDMPAIAAMARRHQPGLIVVDRSVGGAYENYTTPEQQVPAHPMDDPWETCLTMGNSWSYVPNDHYKSTTELVHLLVKIVSRGGNFLLNVGPSPDGDWDDTAYVRLKEMGAWLKINGEGIYNSKPLRPYASGDNIFLTQRKDGSARYVFYLGEGKEVRLPAEVSVDRLRLSAKDKIRLLGVKGGERIKWRQEDRKLVMVIPAKLRDKVVGDHGVVFKVYE